MVKNYIKRDTYLSRIRPYIGQDVIKVLVGQRRVGKSYLLFQIMDELVKQGKKRSELIYINKELFEFDEIRTHRDLIRFVEQEWKGKKSALFLDEIQDIKDFEKALRHFQASGKYDIYCTGSNANLMSGELATYLSGRYVEREVFSLSYGEFLQFHGLADSQESFLKYLRYGGLPYLIHLELTDDIIFDYLRNIYNTIILKDVVARFGVRNVHFLERLIEYVADNVGSLVSAKKISDFLKSQRTNISPHVVLNYLSHLSSAFLVFRVPRTDINGKKIFEINDKYYFEDLGLRHTVRPYQSGDMNKILENLVYMHLRLSGYAVFVGKHGNKEIDFVAEKEGKRVYIQIAYLIADEKTRNREFGNLLDISDNYEKMVVSLDDTLSGDFRGIRHRNIREFLLNFQ